MKRFLVRPRRPGHIRPSRPDAPGSEMPLRAARLVALLLGGLAALPAAAQPTPTLRSEVPAVRLAPLQRLPRAPGGAVPEFCRHLLAAPATAAGKAVAAAGWAVTREAPLGPYQAVAFVAAGESGTSGSCRLTDGNLALFRGGEIVAIAFAAARGAATVATLHPFGTDALRIWDGDFLSQPVADLRLGVDGSLVIQPLAAEERVCGGRAAVPNVYGRRIDEARALLLRQGWSPAPPAQREAADSRAAELVRRGVPEVEDCSGTGFGFCGYAYRGAAGTLNVTTVGDDDFPTVSGYGVTCAR